VQKPATGRPIRW